MTAKREKLTLPTSTDGMEDFSPRPSGLGKTTAVEASRSVDAVSAFPSREATAMKQMNLKGPAHIIDRFRRMCKEDRRSYYDMLEILMNNYEL